MTRIYLDNAATSWPKPPAVYDAVDRYQREIGAAAGRGAYDSAVEAERIVMLARMAVAKLIGARDPSRVVFTASGTEALNLALFGLLRPGDHVVTTVCEHNAVLRPLAQLRSTAGVSVDFVGCDPLGTIDPEDIASAIQPGTKLVATTAASNVTGALQDVDAISRICREHDVPLLVDAAQSLGHVTTDVSASGIDLLAGPCHKGLLGPLGLGFLYVAPGMETHLQPRLLGGTGLQSDLETMPEELPHRYEAGNLNVPALAGLAAGLEYLASESADADRNMALLMAELAKVPGVLHYGPPLGLPRAPVASFNLEGYDPQEVAAILASNRIECRAGLHCAPMMHQALGTHRMGGAVRLSPGLATSEQDVVTVVGMLKTLASSV